VVGVRRVWRADRAAGGDTAAVMTDARTRVLVKCPHCSALVRADRLKKHIEGRCPVRRATVSRVRTVQVRKGVTYIMNRIVTKSVKPPSSVPSVKSC